MRQKEKEKSPRNLQLSYEKQWTVSAIEVFLTLMNEQPTKGLYIVHEICLREQKLTESVCSETGGFPTAAADDIVTMF